MNYLHFPLRISFFITLIFVFTPLAMAQATRTWVSGVGDDVNPCSRTAPCKTFAGAISKTAKGGEISVLDPGGYGSVTITKSITIDGAGMGSILAAGTNGIIVNITDTTDAKVVRLRGLSINGAGTGLQGIKILSANKVSVENTVIDGFTSDGISVAAAGSAQAFVKSTMIRNNAGAGINVSGASQVALSEVTIVYNGTGVTAASGGAIISFKDNIIYGNKKDGDPTSVVGAR